MREEGLTESFYLSPVASEHAVDDYYGDQADYLRHTEALERKDDEEEAVDLDDDLEEAVEQE